MQKIVPNLWFDTNAEEAANFYVSLFSNSRIGRMMHYDDASAAVANMPKGSLLTVEFELAGSRFVALNGGPMFSFTPANSFSVQCATESEIDALWEQLSAGGTVLMPFQEYPFSKKYGWVNDRYGLSWQLSLSDEVSHQVITPSLLFVKEQFGKAGDAIERYTSLFPDSGIDHLVRYEEGDQKDAVQYASFHLCGIPWSAMDSNLDHKFTFTEAVSYMVYCDSQEEIDRYADALSAFPESEQCGWLKDEFGVSWQIVPAGLEAMLYDADAARAARVMSAMLQMKRLDIAALKRAYDGT